MAMIHLPSAVQRRFSATSRIHSFKKAVEELVYNALDANATSIAIRLNIKEHSVQVIDNGDGIRKEDMNHVGKRYMTSKTVDLSTLKAPPESYGFQGQSLASLVEVSQVINITSKTYQSEDTWLKSFQKGKEKEVLHSAGRPSKGTTVEIKGFLYNLTIQKHAVNALSEIQNIKSFLECISLVHNNKSISLRDNSKNEIIFQVNKCRDIYQTFATLFSLEKDKILEFTVEKKFYRVTAYMGKVVTEENENHWIYLNRRFITQCNLHHVLDCNIAKLFNLKKQSKNKKSLKTAYPENEECVFRKHIPFYYVFITCPYNDYNFNTTAEQNMVEFKNWSEITKLLEKLVQFYSSNSTSKEDKIQIGQIDDKMKATDTRDEVKEIMDRILKSNSRKVEMQNGVKGKMVKRCKKKKNNPSSLKNMKINYQKPKEPETMNKVEIPYENIGTRNVDVNSSRQTKKSNKLVQTELDCNDKDNRQRSNKNKTISKKRIDPRRIDSNTEIKNKSGKHYFAKPTSKGLPQQSDVLFGAFQHANSKMKKRCKVLSKDIETLLHFRKSRKREVFSQYTIKTKNQLITVRKRVGKFVVHNIAAVPPKFKEITNEVLKNPVDKNLISSKDLLQTILQSQKQSMENDKEISIHTPTNPHRNRVEMKNIVKPMKIVEDNELSCRGPHLTYNSHGYTKEATIDSHLDNFVNNVPEIVNTRFITNKSKDNFIRKHERNILFRTKFKRNKIKKRHVMYNTLKPSVEHSSYTIEFSNSDVHHKHGKYSELVNKLSLRDGSCISDNLPSQDVLLNGTYSLNRVSVFSEQIEKSCHTFKSADFVENSYNATYTIYKSVEKQHHVPESYNHTMNNISLNSEENENTEINNYPGSLETKINYQNEVNPLNICETVLSSSSVHCDTIRSLMLPENELTDVLNLHENASNENKQKKYVAVNNINVNGESLGDILSLPSDAMATYNAVEETSHHFNDSKQRINNPAFDKIKTFDRSPDFKHKTSNDVADYSTTKTLNIDGNIFHIHKETGMILRNEVDVIQNDFHFNVKNRPRFVPKGMSQILGKREITHASDYNLEEDYFDESLYNEFNKAVETNTEIFETNIDNVNNTTTKEIAKVNAKFTKENASLNFDGESLKQAKLLGQADDKFIAATIKGRTGQSRTYLVLFDQHAVHERIRLESNLAEYVSNNEWKSVNLDELSIRLKPDEIHYLHNYKDKFAQLGLKWNAIDEHVINITGIPQAIIGKNARQVDVIVKSAKNLILEEIEAIKSQKGSICLYPKSIMDLVFSEACRYAIKFGDRLSHVECTKLLRDLSKCKTPFQCAHGRPVMAVITELKNMKAEYKISLTKVAEFKRHLQKFL